MLTNSSVFILDEPTTGLDSKNALDVINISNMLAKNGRTVVSTIHQPSTLIMEKFDSFICLAKGRIIFNGNLQEMIQYFDYIEHPLPPYSNPSEHMIKIMSGDFLDKIYEKSSIAENYPLTSKEKANEENESVTVVSIRNEILPSPEMINKDIKSLDHYIDKLETKFIKSQNYKKIKIILKEENLTKNINTRISICK